VVLVVLIVVSASISGGTKHSLFGGFPSFLHIDKLGHLLGYAGLGFACIRSRWPRVRPWHVLAFAFALGIATELLQCFIPGRTPKLADVLIDTVGACAGIYLARR
jgi:VanZ family protein